MKILFKENGLKKIILTLLISFVFLSAHSQSKHPLLTAQLKVDRVDSLSSFPDYSDTTALYVTHLKVYLLDTVNIAKIHVSVRREKDANIVFQREFNFDQSGALADGCSYVRNKRVIDLGLGDLPGVFHAYTEVKLEKSNGDFTTILSTVR